MSHRVSRGERSSPLRSIVVRFERESGREITSPVAVRNPVVLSLQRFDNVG